MAKRISGIGVNVEYKDTTNKLRISGLGVNVEYKDTTNKCRIAAIGVMVEYIQLAAPAITYGPALQMQQ